MGTIGHLLRPTKRQIHQPEEVFVDWLIEIIEGAKNSFWHCWVGASLVWVQTPLLLVYAEESFFTTGKMSVVSVPWDVQKVLNVPENSHRVQLKLSRINKKELFWTEVLLPFPEVLSVEADSEVVVTGIGDATRGRVVVEVLKGVVLLLTA